MIKFDELNEELNLQASISSDGIQEAKYNFKGGGGGGGQCDYKKILIHLSKRFIGGKTTMRNIMIGASDLLQQKGENPHWISLK